MRCGAAFVASSETEAAAHARGVRRRFPRSSTLVCSRRIGLLKSSTRVCAAARKMPSTYCSVEDCYHFMNSTAGVSYHLLPVNANIKKQWEEAVGYPLPSHARICSAHFRPSDYQPSSDNQQRRRLKRTAVPTIFERRFVFEGLAWLGLTKM